MIRSFPRSAQPRTRMPDQTPDDGVMRIGPIANVVFMACSEREGAGGKVGRIIPLDATGAERPERPERPAGRPVRDDPGQHDQSRTKNKSDIAGGP